MTINKFCPKHGDPKELPHMVDYCTCRKATTFPINLLGELVAVTPENPSGTIRLPDWKRSLKGTVVARGPDALNVSQGATVYFGAAVGMDSVIAGQDVRILKESDLDFVYEA